MSVFLGWMPSVLQQAVFEEQCGKVRAALPPGAPCHNWRRPQQWHMTIRYLGSGLAQDEQAELLTELPAVLASLQPLQTRVAALRYWPQAHVLVAELERSNALRTLFDACEQACRALGFPGEKRAPTPHVTLAYLPPAAVPTAADLPAPVPAALLIDRVALLETVPGAYASRCEWSLQAAHR